MTFKITLPITEIYLFPRSKIYLIMGKLENIEDCFEAA
jgi:hypothetical protein